MPIISTFKTPSHCQHPINIGQNTVDKLERHVYGGVTYMGCITTNGSVSYQKCKDGEKMQGLDIINRKHLNLSIYGDLIATCSVAVVEYDGLHFQANVINVPKNKEILCMEIENGHSILLVGEYLIIYPVRYSEHDRKIKCYKIAENKSEPEAEYTFTIPKNNSDSEDQFIDALRIDDDHFVLVVGSHYIYLFKIHTIFGNHLCDKIELSMKIDTVISSNSGKYLGSIHENGIMVIEVMSNNLFKIVGDYKINFDKFIYTALSDDFNNDEKSQIYSISSNGKIYPLLKYSDGKLCAASPNETENGAIGWENHPREMEAIFKFYPKTMKSILENMRE